ncbi:MAG: hypothetical protein FWE44_05760 [Defluviitaleaceae bacterium]|nr:hypothetical protein [Defluviitaleaceae bacterium]
MKVKCFYCGKRHNNCENLNFERVEFKTRYFCDDACHDEYSEYADFVKLNLSRAVTGYVSSIFLMIASIFGFVFFDGWIGAVVLSVSWFWAGILIYRFPFTAFLTWSTTSLASVKATKKLGKIIGISIMATAPIWLLLPLV